LTTIESILSSFSSAKYYTTKKQRADKVHKWSCTLFPRGVGTIYVLAIPICLSKNESKHTSERFSVFLLRRGTLDFEALST
jgi:hypothetical protein